MYTDKDTLKKYMGVNFTTTLDSFVDKVIASAQKYVERYCGDEKFGDRLFEKPTGDADEVRKFDGDGGTRLYFGDLFALTEFAVDEVILTVDEDFFLYPKNAKVKINNKEAYRWAELTQPSKRLSSNSRQLASEPYTFEELQDSVEITGKFYFSDVAPDDIELATLKIASAIIKENVADDDVKELKGEKFDDYSATYQEVNKIAHALKVTDILDLYKRSDRDSGSSFGSVGRIIVS